MATALISRSIGQMNSDGKGSISWSASNEDDRRGSRTVRFDSASTVELARGFWLKEDPLDPQTPSRDPQCPVLIVPAGQKINPGDRRGH